MTFRPNDAVNILKRPIHKVLTGNDVITVDSEVEPQKSYPSLECYEKPKKRNRSNDKLDELIEEYADLKNERKELLIEQTKYYKNKNERENELFKIDLQIRKIQKEEEEIKLSLLKKDST